MAGEEEIGKVTNFFLSYRVLPVKTLVRNDQFFASSRVGASERQSRKPSSVRSAITGASLRGPSIKSSAGTATFLCHTVSERGCEARMMVVRFFLASTARTVAASHRKTFEGARRCHYR